jgi:hypothetical protein
MLRGQFLAYILGISTFLGVQRETVTGCGLVEPRLRVSRGQTFEELLKRFRDSVVKLVSRCPESILQNS